MDSPKSDFRYGVMATAAGLEELDELLVQAGVDAEYTIFFDGRLYRCEESTLRELQAQISRESTPGFAGVLVCSILWNQSQIGKILDFVKGQIWQPVECGQSVMDSNHQIDCPRMVPRVQP